MAGETFNRIRFDQREQASAKEALREYVIATRPDLESDLFDSKLGDAHMDALAFLMESLAVQQDIIANEVFLETCERYASALKHARKLGYSPSRATSSSVTCIIAPIPQDIQDYGVTIPAGTNYVSGDKTYEVVDDHIIEAGESVYSFAMSEGVTNEIEFESDGTSYQIFVTPSNSDARMTVAEGSWKVYVDGELWEEADTIFTVLGPQKMYSTEQTESGELRIIFGNNDNGKIPDNGASISVIYRDCIGEDGQIPAEAISGNMIVKVNGEDLRVSIYNPEKSSGGSDRESIDSIKKYAPAHFRTNDKLITPRDFEVLSASYSDVTYGSVAKAKVKLREGSLLVIQGCVMEEVIPAGTEVNLGGNCYRTLEDIDLTAERNPSLFVDPNTVDIYLWGETGDQQYYGPVSVGLKDSLLEYAEERAVATVRVNIKDGGVVPIDLDFGKIICDRSYKLDNESENDPGITQNIETALDEFFHNVLIEPGQDFRVSDIIHLIDAIPGVIHFELATPTGDVEIKDTEMFVRGAVSYQLEHKLLSTTDFRGRY